MSIWLISANPKVYDHAASFSKNGYIDWGVNGKFELDDIVYIYCSKPIKEILFKTIIENVDVPQEMRCDDREFWKSDEKYIASKSRTHVRMKLLSSVSTNDLSLSTLRNYGLNNAPQGHIHVKEPLLQYLGESFC